MKAFVSVFFTLCWAWSSIGQGLYVGTNYHPHDDKDLAKVERDIGLMKAAGFTVVRMGHLAWDSYEPSEGQFDFAWFDQVMDLMDKAGIKVILDIAVRPAPLWLHNVLLTIADEGGRPVFRKSQAVIKGDNSIPLYLPRLAKGIYFLSVSGAGVAGQSNPCVAFVLQ